MAPYTMEGVLVLYVSMSCIVERFSTLQPYSALLLFSHRLVIYTQRIDKGGPLSTNFVFFVFFCS